MFHFFVFFQIDRTIFLMKDSTEKLNVTKCVTNDYLGNKKYDKATKTLIEDIP